MKHLSTAVCLWLITTSSLLADVIPGRWEKLEAQPLGSEIVVALKSGAWLEGRFRGLGPDHLTIELHSGEARQLVKQEIHLVQGPAESTSSTRRNGALIGALVGLAFSGLTVWQENFSGSGTAGLTAIITGVATAGGFFIGKATKTREILYKAAPKFK